MRPVSKRPSTGVRCGRPRHHTHIDIDLKVASQATSVTVEAMAVVQTDASNVAETKGSLELTDLPVAIARVPLDPPAPTPR
jgi:hypothetical protein